MDFSPAVVGSRDGRGHVVVVTETDLVQRRGVRQGGSGRGEGGRGRPPDHQQTFLHLDTHWQPLGAVGGGEVLISAASSPLQTTREELSQVVNKSHLRAGSGICVYQQYRQ